MSRNRRKRNSEHKSGLDRLHDWLLSRLEQNRERQLPALGPTECSLVAYHFRPQETADQSFQYLESAIRETWRHCGLLTTIIVTNEVTDAMRAFAEPFGFRVQLQTEPTLVPNRPETMSMDLNGRLVERFHTPYALLIQEDAFPLRPGLGHFLETYDFYGAPRTSDSWLASFGPRLFNCRLMNGMFSLRTRRLCELVAEQWRMQYADEPFRREFYHDRFCTDTLPRKSFAYRKEVKFPTAHEAAVFCYDSESTYRSPVPPFGFHGAKAFRMLCDSGKYQL